MKQYLKETMGILSESVLSVDDEKFEKLVTECMETLDNHGKIIISGLGKNVPICEKFVGTMLSLGLEANFMHTNTAVHGDIGMVKDDDLVIALSKSGETAETIYLVDKLLQRESKVWLFTFNENPSLKDKVHDVLSAQLEHEGDKWNLVPSNSTTVNLIILQSIALEIAKRRNVDLTEFKRNHPGGHIGEILQNA